MRVWDPTLEKPHRALSLAFALVALAITPRAGQGDSWPADAILPLSESRIESLPSSQRGAWRAYWTESERRAGLLSAPLPSKDLPIGPGPATYSRGLRLDAPATWYASAEAATLADRVVAWQSAAGGWTKGHDYLGGKPSEESGVWSRGTLDNGATTTELRFLARVVGAKGDPSSRWTAALVRGVDTLLAAQYPNGGFPQVYPLAGSYHDAVTYNDSAMLNALELIRSVARGEGGFVRVPLAQRHEAARRLSLGIDCVLASRIRTASGRRTVWAQQHDALTLRPSAARNFEPASASAAESSALALFLMSLERPSGEVVTAIHETAAWFERVTVGRLLWDREVDSGEALRPAPDAPRLWARLYDIDTDQPVFGDRDRSVHAHVTAISAERRRGYAWYGVWPEQVLVRYAEWKDSLVPATRHP